MTVSLLANKRILLGVTGSIAAYKSAELIRRLRELGAHVRVVMTPNAKQFITPLTLQAVSGTSIHDDLFDLQAEAAMGHIELARWADIILVAPASANFIAALAQGQANNLLTTLCLATKSPIAIAPAMNEGMWHHRLTQHNIQILKQHHIHILGPGEGSQACGEMGLGRLLEPTMLIDEVSQLFVNDLLAGLSVLITAGPTIEPIDPVRYISNHSSGKMGYALAAAAQEASARVTLISGPVNCLPPGGVETIRVQSASDMHEAVMRKVTECDIFFSVAAVADYRLNNIAEQKIPKGEKKLSLTLIPNVDIVKAVAALPRRPFIIGFAAETHDVLAKAKLKRERKKMDVIIANQVGEQLGMNQDENAVTVISHQGNMHFPRTDKTKLARQLIPLISQLFNEDKKNGKINGRK